MPPALAVGGWDEMMLLCSIAGHLYPRGAGGSGGAAARWYCQQPPPIVLSTANPNCPCLACSSCGNAASLSTPYCRGPRRDHAAPLERQGPGPAAQAAAAAAALGRRARAQRRTSGSARCMRARRLPSSAWSQRPPSSRCSITMKLPPPPRRAPPEKNQGDVVARVGIGRSPGRLSRSRSRPAALCCG